MEEGRDCLAEQDFEYKTNILAESIAPTVFAKDMLKIAAIISLGIWAFLLFVWIKKFVAIWKAIRWLRNHGKSFKDRLDTELPVSQSDYQKLFEACNGDFWPHGVKDFKLTQNLESIKGSKPVCYRIKWLYKNLFFRFNRLIVVTSVYLFFAAGFLDLKQPVVFLTAETHSFLLYLLAVIALATNFLPFIEAVYSYAILGSYAVSFHMQTPDKDGRDNRKCWLSRLRSFIFGRIHRTSLLSELRVFIFKVLATVGAGATAFYIAHINYYAYQGNTLINPNQSDLWSRIKMYWQGVYFTATTFATVGYGDIEPANGKGQLISFLVEAQAFSLVIIVFAALIAFRTDNDRSRLLK